MFCDPHLYSATLPRDINYPIPIPFAGPAFQTWPNVPFRADVPWRADVPYQQHLMRDVPFQQSLMRDIPFQQHLMRDVPYQQSLMRDIPFQQHLMRDVPYQQSLMRDIPFQQHLMRDIPFQQNLMWDVPKFVPPVYGYGQQMPFLNYNLPYNQMMAHPFVQQPYNLNLPLYNWQRPFVY